MAKKKWSELSQTQQRLIVVTGLVELAVTTVAARDLAQRPAESVRGPKWVWRVGFLVQPFGPIAYLVLGRR